MRTVALVLLLWCGPLGFGLARAEDPERVVMGLEEFLALYEKARPSTDRPPRDHTISSARYRADVVFEDGAPHAARFRARLRIRALQDRGWVRIPVLSAAVALRSATIAGVDAPVFVDGDFYTLATDRRGDFDLDLVFAAAVTNAEGSSEVSFQLVPSGATELELSVPADEDLDFTVANAKLTTDERTKDARVVEAVITSVGKLAVTWQRKVPPSGPREARVYSEVHALVSVGDGVVRSKASVHETILFAGVDHFAFTVPEGMTVLAVEGAGVRDWKLADGQLDVQLSFAAERTYVLTIEMERPLRAGDHRVTVPLPRPLQVERSKGWIGVEAHGSLELEAAEVHDATAVDVRALPAAILGITSQPLLLGYKFVGDAPKVAIDVAEHDEIDLLVTVIDRTAARTLWTDDGRRLTAVRYNVRNNRRQYLRLTMPEGAELWSAEVAGGAVEPTADPDGRVMIPLLRASQLGSMLGAFPIEFVYVEHFAAPAPGRRGRFSARLPIPDAPSTYVAWTFISATKTRSPRRSFAGNLRRVDELTDPPALQHLDLAVPQVSAKEPLRVQVPLTVGPSVLNFEKLLARDEALEIAFTYRRPRRP